MNDKQREEIKARIKVMADELEAVLVELQGPRPAPTVRLCTECHTVHEFKEGVITMSERETFVLQVDGKTYTVESPVLGFYDTPIWERRQETRRWLEQEIRNVNKQVNS